MKKTLTTITSAAALAVAANAQTFVDFSALDDALVNSAAGQDFTTVTGATVNVKQMVAGTNFYRGSHTGESGEAIQVRTSPNHQDVSLRMTFSNLAANERVWLMDDESMSSGETVHFYTNGTDWTQDQGSLTGYQPYAPIVFNGTEVTMTGSVPSGQGYALSRGARFYTDNATIVEVRTFANQGINGFALATAVVNPVPEPSSTALLGLGGLALILRRRK